MFNIASISLLICLASCQSAPLLVKVVEEVGEEISEDVIVAESEKATPKLPGIQPQKEVKVQDAPR